MRTRTERGVQEHTFKQVVKLALIYLSLPDTIRKDFLTQTPYFSTLFNIYMSMMKMWVELP